MFQQIGMKIKIELKKNIYIYWIHHFCYHQLYSLQLPRLPHFYWVMKLKLFSTLTRTISFSNTRFPHPRTKNHSSHCKYVGNYFRHILKTTTTTTKRLTWWIKMAIFMSVYLRQHVKGNQAHFTPVFTSFYFSLIFFKRWL